MFGYCPGCDDEQVYISPGEEGLHGFLFYIAEVRAEREEKRMLKKRH
ncbi:MAG: hypothetical protein PHS80_01670 [Methanothrix sp.]|nr:hypothetical protein [Methanothrix sp.]MDD4446226.1 hypothetical protein [Methanothrix sp.]